jgi:hypothetical protein
LIKHVLRPFWSGQAEGADVAQHEEMRRFRLQNNALLCLRSGAFDRYGVQCGRADMQACPKKRRGWLADRINQSAAATSCETNDDCKFAFDLAPVSAHQPATAGKDTKKATTPITRHRNPNSRLGQDFEARRCLVSALMTSPTRRQCSGGK